MKLSVVECTSNFKQRFIEFNTKIYSKRKTSLEQAEYKWNIQNGFPNIPHLLALDEESIIGQIVFFPAKCFYSNNEHTCVFAFDYIVAPDYLNTGVGVKLLSKTIKNHIHFGIGVSDISRKLHLVLKEKSIGNIHKYLFAKNFLTYFYASIKTYLKANVRKIPSKIFWQEKFELNSLKCIKTNFSTSYTEAWNDGLIEFERNRDFMKLRFESFLSTYVCYQIFDSQQKQKGYFVLRVEIWRGICVLIVSDYRVKKDNIEAIDFMLQVSKKLMKYNKLDAVLFGSSLKFIDQRLIKQNFKKVGLSSEIFTNLPLDNNWEVKASERNLIMATPADSDFEFNFGDELWKR